jgi:aminocarboxymuconate-semialdehyde decarboxylase
VVASAPQRFVGLGTLPMQAPALAVRELERCMKTLGLAGVQVGSHVNDWNLSDPALFEVFAAAAELGAAVFVHPWDMMGEARMRKYWLPWLVGMPAEASLAICSVIFGGVLERLPRLRIAFAHGGGAFPGTLGRIEHGFDCRPDLVAVDNPVPPRSYLGRFWVDSLVHDPDMLRLIVKLFGEDRVMLGSDYPFPLGESEPGALIRSVPELLASRARLLGDNALGWLGRPGQSW